MTLGELVNMVGDLAEIAVAVLLAYITYKLALLVETISKKIA
jgi:hypothetical protein